MLATLDDVKNYLGIPLADTTQDAFLTQQIALVSESIEGYCGRKFEQDEYIQTFYRKDYGDVVTDLQLFHYPVSSLAYVQEAGEDVTEVRLHKPSGYITRDKGFFYEDTVEVRYTAGFTSIPAPVLHVFYQVIEGNYNKKISGVGLNFGNDVQRISIAGVMSVDFDYRLESNQRKNAYGTILGNFMNVLDSYRSERVLVGQGTLKYVEEA